MDNQYQQSTENINSGNKQQPQEPSKNKRYLVIALFILAFLIVGGSIIGYFFLISPFSTAELPSSVEVKDKDIKTSGDGLDTSDWKTYQNKEWKIEYKYPSDWKKRGDEANTPKWLNSSVMLYKKSTTQTYPDPKFPLDALISIKIMDNPSNQSLQEIFIGRHEECLNEEKKAEAAGEVGSMGCPGFEDISSWKKIIVDGKSALHSGKRSIPEGLPIDSVYIQSSKKFLVISATYYNDKYSTQLSDIFNEFISTIKFTK